MTSPRSKNLAMATDPTKPNMLISKAMSKYSAEPNCKPSTSRIRSEEHTSELQSLMRISYAVFCLKKKIEQTKLYYIYYQTQSLSAILSSSIIITYFITRAT